MKTNRKIHLLCMAFLSGPIANAAEVTIPLNGSVSTITFRDCLSYSTYCTSYQSGSTSLATTTFFNGLSILSKDVFSASFTYNTSTPMASTTSDGTVAFYDLSQSSFSVGQVSLPSQTLPSPQYSSLGIGNGSFGFKSDALSVDARYQNPEWTASVFIYLRDSSGTTYSNVSLPSSVDLSDFDSGTFEFTFTNRLNGDYLVVDGNIDGSFRPQPPQPPTVPTPAAAWLFGSGLIGLAGIRRGRSRFL